MSNQPQLKDVKPIIEAILAERDKIPLIIDQERYLPNPQPYHDGNMIRGGLRKALRIIESAPIVRAVPVVFCDECVEYERDCGYCDYWEVGRRTDDYCSRGKRRETKA